eukprot:4858964-Pyramimonas_sp.AAC.1
MGGSIANAGEGMRWRGVDGLRWGIPGGSIGGEAWLPTQKLCDQIDRFVQTHSRALLIGGASVRECDDQRVFVKRRAMPNEQVQSVLAIPSAENALCYRRLARVQREAQRPRDD